jgi:DNA-directed RNA polymerase sigma subunit (sigma70/sigma32)
MSFVEVGKRMEVSSEYGRRLCHAALNKLRQAAEEGAIEPALLF